MRSPWSSGDNDAQIVDSVMWQPGEDQLIVGEKIHYTDIDESQHILRSNLRGSARATAC